MLKPWSAYEFSKKVIDYYHECGRKNLPWHNTKDAYKIWLSEVMLQQTQVQTVIPYYKKFLSEFKEVVSLANADSEQVLHLWSGLGYYSRARNLHKAAQMVRDKYSGKFPQDPKELEGLPGVGRSTAGAIAAFAFDAHSAILDGNVKRVLARAFGIEGWYGKSSTLKQLWELSEKLTPAKETANYNQAMMDLGAVVCKRSKPLCDQCPLSKKCIALRTHRVDELPHKKPKKVRPNKSIYWLLNMDGNKIMLEKRPPSGIWGGLWSLPEISLDELGKDAQKVLLEKAQKLPTILHKFSHYDLQIQPLIFQKSMQANNKNSIIADKNNHWFDITQPMDIGLPAPLAKLLEHSSLVTP